MAVKVNIVRPEVLDRREESRVASPPVLAPCLCPQWEDRYPFLRDDLLQVRLLVPRSVPRYLALAHPPRV